MGADWKALKETLAESLNSDIDLLNRTNQALLANGVILSYCYNNGYHFCLVFRV